MESSPTQPFQDESAHVGGTPARASGCTLAGLPNCGHIRPHTISGAQASEELPGRCSPWRAGQHRNAYQAHEARVHHLHQDLYQHGFVLSHKLVTLSSKGNTGPGVPKRRQSSPSHTLHSPFTAPVSQHITSSPLKPPHSVAVGVPSSSCRGARHTCFW